MIGFVAGNSS